MKPLTTFCLTIPRLKARQEVCKDNWTGLDIEFVNGYDATELPFYESERRLGFLYANLLGHVNIWKRIMQLPDGYYMVVEDDTKPILAIADIFDLIEKSIKTFWWECLRLHSLQRNYCWVGYLSETHRLVNSTCFVSAGSYVIHSGIAKRLLDNLWPCPADKFMHCMCVCRDIVPNPIITVGVSTYEPSQD